MDIPPRAALFVDLASLDVMTTHHVVRVQHGQLLERLTQDRRLVRAAAYGTRDDDHPDAEQRLAELAAAGFKVVAKPMRRRADGVRRASLSVNIAVDALELAPRLDALSLLTTDADFATLIEAVQRRGVRVEVVTSRELAPPALMEAADAVIEFASLIDRESPESQRPRNLPTERGNARARLDPPPRRRPQRRSSGKRDPQPVEAAAAADASEAKGKTAPAPAQPTPDRAAEAPSRQPSEPQNAAPARPSVKVLPQEKLSGRAVRPSPDEA